MRTPFVRRLALVTVLAAATLPSAAHADSIDGEWCSAAGKHLSIKGDDIVTPGGNHTHGTYNRHAFTYAVPAGEPGAGWTVFMRLVNERTVHLTSAPGTAPVPGGAIETWLRCDVTS